MRELVKEGKYAEATTEAQKMLGPDPEVHFIDCLDLIQNFNVHNLSIESHLSAPLFVCFFLFLFVCSFVFLF